MRRQFPKFDYGFRERVNYEAMRRERLPDKSDRFITISPFLNVAVFFAAAVGGPMQFITGTAYAGEPDAFGIATMTRGAVSIAPSLYIDADSFNSASVATTGFVTTTLYTDADTFNNAAVVPGAATLTGTLFSDADSFNNAAVKGLNVVAPALFSDADSFNSAGIVTVGMLTTTLFTDSDTFGLGSVGLGASPTQGITPALFTDADAFNNATLIPGAVTITGTLFTDADTFNSAGIVTAGMLTTTLFSDADTFNSAALVIGAVTITGTLFTDADSFNNAAVKGLNTIAPALFTDADTFNNGAVKGLNTVTPALFTDVDSFNSATLVPGAVAVTGTLFSDADSFNSATLVPGAVTITGTLFSDADTFNNAAVKGFNAVAPALFTDADTFNAATLTLAIAGSLFANPNTFNSASLSNALVISGLVMDGDSITQGVYVSATTIPQLLAASTGLQVDNLAVAGKLLTAMDTDYTDRNAHLYNASGRNALLITGGINDILSTSGITLATLSATIRSYCGKARTTGFKVYVGTLLPTNFTGTTAGMQTLRTQFNADIVANWASFADGLMDIGAIASLQNTADTTYYQSDQLHLTSAGNVAVAGYLDARLRTYATFAPYTWAANLWASHWYDPDDNTTVFSDTGGTTQATAGSSTVKRLSDKIGGLHLTEATAPGSYITAAASGGPSRKSIKYASASAQRLSGIQKNKVQAISGGEDRGFTVVMALRRGTTGVTGNVIGLSTDAGTAGEFNTLYLSAANTLAVQKAPTTGGATTVSATGTPMASDIWSICTWLFLPRSVTFRVNGATLTTVALDTTPLNIIDMLEVGALFDNTAGTWGFGFNGYQGETLIAHDDSLTTRVQAAETYLGGKYGITILNPVQAAWNITAKNAGLTLSNGDKTATTSTTGNQGVLGTNGVAAGESRYFEIGLDSYDTAMGVGIGTAAVSLSTYMTDTNTAGTYKYNGSANAGCNNVLLSATAFVPVTGNRVGILVDRVANRLYMRVQGTWVLGDGTAGTGGIPISALTATVFPMITTGAVGNKATLYATAASFTTAAPAGSLPLV